MTGTPLSPRLLKGGIAILDANSGVVVRVIALQYNPDTLTRTLQVQSVTQESADRTEAIRLKGPPIETYKLEAEVDAANQATLTDSGIDQTAQYGIAPQLAALETIIYPASRQLETNRDLANQGVLEIAPMEAPMTLFIWNRTRVVPVRFTEFSVTEEAFDPDLNPVRAKISLSMRVLSVFDLGFDSRGGNLFMSYQRGKERLSALDRGVELSATGLGGLP